MQLGKTQPVIIKKLQQFFSFSSSFFFFFFFLTFTSLQANSADDKLMVLFLFLPENKLLHFMSLRRRPFTWNFLGNNKKNISKCCLPKLLPNMLSAYPLALSAEIQQKTNCWFSSDISPRKKGLIFNANYLLWWQFAWIQPHFLEKRKIEKYFNPCHAE